MVVLHEMLSQAEFWDLNNVQLDENGQSNLHGMLQELGLHSPAVEKLRHDDPRAHSALPPLEDNYSLRNSMIINGRPSPSGTPADFDMSDLISSECNGGMDPSAAAWLFDEPVLLDEDMQYMVSEGPTDMTQTTFPDAIISRELQSPCYMSRE